MAESTEADALRKELEWTRTQHARWQQEHQELVAFVRELKARTEACEAARLKQDERADFEKLKQWTAELDEANRWFKSQLEAWEASYRKLEAGFEEQKSYIADLIAARDFHAEQNRKLKIEIESLRKRS